MVQKILVIAHNDLDGIAGAVAIKAAHSMDHVVLRFCTYSNVDSTLIEALNQSRMPYDRIVLVDICFNPESDSSNFSSVTDRWNAKFYLPASVQKYTKNGGELVVIDHHPRAMGLQSTFYASVLHPDSIIQMSDFDGNLLAGSDLASIYFARKVKQDKLVLDPVEVIFSHALRKLCSIAGTYDVWNKNSPDFSFGSKLAMVQSLMLDDCYGFFNELEATLKNAVALSLSTPSKIMNESFWRKALTPILSVYLKQAELQFEKEVHQAKKSAIQHHPKLHEIHAKFFESLVAEEIYNKSEGIVIIRYENPREKSSKLSLRKHYSLPINLGNIAKEFGGGGHAAAAGMLLKSNSSIQDVIDFIVFTLDTEYPRKRFV